MGAGGEGEWVAEMGASILHTPQRGSIGPRGLVVLNHWKHWEHTKVHNSEIQIQAQTYARVQ